MKKSAVLFLVMFLSVTGFAQVKLGLRLAPGLAVNSVIGDDVFDAAEPNGASVRFSAGPIADFFFADNYAISTGLWYTVKRASFRVPNGSLTEDAVGTLGNQTIYNLQMIQVPLTVKLYTNEVAPDIRVYFQLGGTFDAKLAEKAKEENNNILATLSEAQDEKAAYKPIDVSLYLGAGAEMVLGENTALFGGLSYNRGLVNALGRLDYAGTRINNDLKIRNQLVSLEVGIKF
ncbi:MAG: PorT family protein [Cytophagales bacterium]|nr:PorT family protein [Cytophagales bacterium]